MRRYWAPMLTGPVGTTYVGLNWDQIACRAIISRSPEDIIAMLRKLCGYFKRQPLSAPQSPAAATASKPDLDEMRRKLLDKAIDQYWSSNFEVTKDFRVEFVRDVAGDIREGGLKILASENPLMKNREALVAIAMSMARLDVLVADKKVDPDNPLFLQPAISGELKPLIFELWKVDEQLRELIEPVVKMERKSWDDVWNPILFKYRVCWAKANIYNVLRAAVGDGDPSSADDWFRKLVLCLAVQAEDEARKKLNMPTLLDNDRTTSGLIALCVGSIWNRVIEGHERPEVMWRQMLSDSDIGRRALSKVML